MRRATQVVVNPVTCETTTEPTWIELLANFPIRRCKVVDYKEYQLTNIPTSEITVSCDESFYHEVRNRVYINLPLHGEFNPLQKKQPGENIQH